jgi:hypothetical protein
MRRVMLLSLLLALLVPGAAQANPFTPEVEADYQAAVIWWGQGEPIGCLTIEKELVDPAEIEGNAGMATQPAPGTQVPCKIRISFTLLPCQVPGVMRHEVGHLLGHEHSGTPGDVMYAGGAPTPECATEAATRADTEAAEHVAWLEGRATKEYLRCPHVHRRFFRRQCWHSMRVYLQWAAEAREGR